MEESQRQISKISCEDYEETESKDLRVLVTVPSTGHWHSHMGQCLADMVALFAESRYDAGNKTIQVIGLRGTLPEVRNRCVAEAITRGATHHLWVDSDMVFPM